MKKLFLAIISILIIIGGIFLVYLNKPPIKIEQPVQPPSEFSIIVLPDTQVYSENYLEIFQRQTRWIVEEQEEKNIVFVSHTGDITNSWNKKAEWENAYRVIELLNGVVPYGLLPGNHDDPNMFNLYFPFSDFEKYPWWGGHYGEDNNNNYQLFSVDGLDFIVVNLQVNPTKDVLQWAEKVLKTHSDRRAILTTHYFLDYDGFRSPLGEQIFNSLSDNHNLFLILCGHSHTEGKKIDYIDGRPIYQLLADYQVRANGGNGWLRILKFIPAENKIQVQTYSPYLKQFENDDNSQFELEYEMN